MRVKPPIWVQPPNTLMLRKRGIETIRLIMKDGKIYKNTL